MARDQSTSQSLSTEEVHKKLVIQYQESIEKLMSDDLKQYANNNETSPNEAQKKRFEQLVEAVIQPNNQSLITQAEQSTSQDATLNNLQAYIAPSQDPSKKAITKKAISNAMSERAHILNENNPQGINLGWILGHILAWGKRSQHQQYQGSSLSLVGTNLRLPTMAQWQTFGNVLRQYQVTSLHIGMHGITAQGFGHMLQQSQVISLSIKANYLERLTDTQWRVFGQILQQSHIVSLDLFDNELFRLNESRWQAFCNALQQSKVRSLNLSRNKLNQLTEAQWETFGNALQHSQVTSLNLTHNRLAELTEAQWRSFTQALQQTHITQLDLRNNGLSQLSVERWMTLAQTVHKGNYAQTLAYALHALAQKDLLDGETCHQLLQNPKQALKLASDRGASAKANSGIIAYHEANEVGAKLTVLAQKNSTYRSIPYDLLVMTSKFADNGFISQTNPNPQNEQDLSTLTPIPEKNPKKSALTNEETNTHALNQINQTQRRLIHANLMTVVKQMIQEQGLQDQLQQYDTIAPIWQTIQEQVSQKMHEKFANYPSLSQQTIQTVVDEFGLYKG